MTLTSHGQVNKTVVFLLIAVGVISFVAFNATPYMLLATLSYFLLAAGLALRKVRRLHAAFMLTAITADLLIVLILQIQRNAIQTAVSFSLTPLQQFHVGFSVVATFLYFPVLFLGIFLLKKPHEALRLLHIRLALTAFTFRTLGFITMFTLLPKL